jgi:hypothetical protein
VCEGNGASPCRCVAPCRRPALQTLPAPPPTILHAGLLRREEVGKAGVEDVGVVGDGRQVGDLSATGCAWRAQEGRREEGGMHCPVSACAAACACHPSLPSLALPAGFCRQPGDGLGLGGVPAQPEGKVQPEAASTRSCPGHPRASLHMMGYFMAQLASAQPAAPSYSRLKLAPAGAVAGRPWGPAGGGPANAPGLRAAPCSAAGGARPRRAAAQGGQRTDAHFWREGGVVRLLLAVGVAPVSVGRARVPACDELWR